MYDYLAFAGVYIKFRKSELSVIDDKSSVNSKNQSYDKLNFFMKPSSNELYKKVQKEQEQMEGYLGENPDDFGPMMYNSYANNLEDITKLFVNIKQTR